jgi:hypothetical protein
MRFFKRGETADSKFTFLNSETNEPIDILNPLYKITYFDGPNEMIVIAETSLQKVVGEVGVYIVNWLIPNTVLENETYFITAKGTHPIDGTITVIEDFYRVLPASFFSGGGGGAGGIVAKFTKP